MRTWVNVALCRLFPDGTAARATAAPILMADPLASMAHPPRILLGVFGAPHGVRGQLRLKSMTGEPADIGRYGPLTTEDGSRTFRILALHPLKADMLVSRIEGVDDRDSAAALTNTGLYVERTRLPAPDEDEFYHADLIGLVAEDPDGSVLGRVAAVLNFGAGDLLAVRRDGSEDRLVPFTRAFVPVLDFAGGRLVVSAAALALEDPDDVGPAGPDEGALP